MAPSNDKEDAAGWPRDPGRSETRLRLRLLSTGLLGIFSVLLLAVGLFASMRGGDRLPTAATNVYASPTTSPKSASGQALQPAFVDASQTKPPSKDAAGNPVYYDAENAVDGNPQTAWITPGDGRGESLTLLFGHTVHVTQVGLIPGYAKTDPADGTDRFTQYRRIRKARFSFSDGAHVDATFSDQSVMQFIRVNAYTDLVNIEILSTTKDYTRDATAISEVSVKGSA